MGLKLVIQKFHFKNLLIRFKRFCKTLNSFVSFLSALATVGAFGLAIWIYNFTSLPEQLIQKFNSEISSLNEELVDMRKEKRTIESLLFEEKSKLNTAIQEQETIIAKLGAAKEVLELEIGDYKKQKVYLEKNLRITQNQNLYNKKYRTEYLADNVSSIFGRSFTESMDQEIGRLKRQAELARDYILFVNPPIAEPNETKQEYSLLDRVFSKREIAINEMKRKSELISQRIERLPNSWLGAEMRVFEVDADPRVHRYSTSELFRIESSENGKILTGMELLTKHLKGREKIIENLPKEDRKKVYEVKSAYLNKYQENLNNRVNFYISMSASDQEVVNEGKQVLENIGLLEGIVMNMSNELAEMVRNGELLAE